MSNASRACRKLNSGFCLSDVAPSSCMNRSALSPKAPLSCGVMLLYQSFASGDRGILHPLPDHRGELLGESGHRTVIFVGRQLLSLRRIEVTELLITFKPIWR